MKKVFTTKKEIIETANQPHGGFVNTGGEWEATKTPKQFKEMLEKNFKFKVVKCYETKHSTAIAITEEGIEVAWNGYCLMQ